MMDTDGTRLKFIFGTISKIWW